MGKGGREMGGRGEGKERERENFEGISSYRLECLKTDISVMTRKGIF